MILIRQSEKKKKKTKKQSPSLFLHLVKNLIFAAETGEKPESGHRDACGVNPAVDGACAHFPAHLRRERRPLLSPAAVLRACVDPARPYLGARGLEECSKGRRWM